MIYMFYNRNISETCLVATEKVITFAPALREKLGWFGVYSS